MTSELTGTAKDTDIRFSITVSGYTLTYTGKMQGDAWPAISKSRARAERSAANEPKGDFHHRAAASSN
jgi:hypothetical protein